MYTFIVINSIKFWKGLKLDIDTLLSDSMCSTNEVFQMVSCCLPIGVNITRACVTELHVIYVPSLCDVT